MLGTSRAYIAKRQVTLLAGVIDVKITIFTFSYLLSTIEYTFRQCVLTNLQLQVAA